MRIERSDFIRVTNTLAETIRSKFDGQDYVFKPNEPEDIHFVLAKHIFGFGEDDKSRALARLGWMQSSEQLPRALEKLASVKFSAAPALVEEAPADLVALSAAERVPDRTSSVGPLAGGGEAGAGASSSSAPAEPTPQGKRTTK